MSCVRDVSNAGTGCASAIGIDGPRAADVSADGRSLYVAARDGDSVAVSGRDTTTGALTWQGCFRDVESALTGCPSVLDGAPLSTDTTAPYGCSWDTTATAHGSHTLTATAFDAAGNQTQVTRSVTVDQPPTVQLTSPVEGSTFTTSLSFTATASDDAGVAWVEFYVDGLLKATDATAPYSGSWVPSQSSVYGPRRVTAKAIDAQGLSATSSVTVTRVR